MPRIVAAASALPPHAYSQTDIRSAAESVFAGRLPELEALLRVFDNARIDRRQFVKPLPWYLGIPSAGERHSAYYREGYALAEQAARLCLEREGCPPESVEHVIFVSSTGLATPTFDSRLIQALGMRPGTSRQPLWGLGCAGGAAGLSRAYDYCRAYPEARVLLVALECCSLTFMEDDLTRKNLIGSAIFSDGAAAVLVAGADVATTGPRIRRRASHLFPGSERIMGWDFVDGGMRLVLSPRLPALVQEVLQPLVSGFLRDSGFSPPEVKHYLTHPGGARVVDAYRSALGLSDADLFLTEELLRDHGNVSSVSVLMILERWLGSERSHAPGPALLSAFGPGFSSEMLLLEA